MGFVLFHTTKKIKTFGKKCEVWAKQQSSSKKEEDKELQRSTKKVKEDHRVEAHHIASPSYGEEGNRSHKEKLIGEISGVFE